VLDLLLEADAQTFGERCLESTIDVCREQLGGNGCMRQRTERSPEKETRSLADCCTRLKQILIGRKTGQTLDVAEVNNRVRGNQRMSWRNHAIQSIDSDEESRRERTRNITCCDLRVRQVRGDA